MNGSLTVALGGNPNIGKSTLFNFLTGKNQHVGNWPGKTVERVEGRFTYHGKLIKVVDLPGTYSLNADSLEEMIARDFLLREKPDVVLAMADATNLERNLYLVLQLMEITPRLVLAVNMMDVAQRQGTRIDADKLSAALGIPVVSISAATGQGIDGLLKTVVEVGEGLLTPHPRVYYGQEIERCLEKLGALLESVAIDWPRRWTALKLLENNRAVEEELKSAGRPEILEQAALCRELLGPAPQSKIIAALYRFAHQIAAEAVAGQNNGKKTLTEKLDGIILHRLAAFPIMLATLGTIFAITLFGAAPLSDWLGALFAWLAETAKNVLVSWQAPFWLVGMLVDGLITGLGAVISVMLPTMAIFFVIFALLEDAGFVPRLAFLMDRPMKAVGSQGKHCVSCLLAFGCSIPAVYSTRIMAGSHRLLAMLTCSLLPCNGRLGVMLAATGVFFNSYAPLVMMALIALAAAAMMAGTFLLHRIFFRGDNPSFILELPPYRLPRLRPVIVRTLREKVWHVLSRAALLAAPITVTIWLLSNLPAGPSPTITQQLARLLEPAGLFFGLDGKTLVAALYALPAKEVVLGALAITNGLSSSLGGSAVLENHLLARWSGLQAFTFLVFFMLYLPCTYTAAVIYKESRSVQWTLLGIFLPLVMALAITWTVYRVGLLLGC